MRTEQIDFEKVTAGLKTKSDKIRALSRHGVPTAEIARYLDIRYQHARNVLVEAGLHRTGDGAAAGVPASAPTASRERKSAWCTIDAEGRLQLPADLMDKRGLEAGARVYVGLTDEGLELLSQRGALARAQAIARRYIPDDGRSMVDELIAERRREAERENG